MHRSRRQNNSPDVKNGSHADPGAEMFGIGRDREHGLGRRLEEQAVDDSLVLIGDCADRGRQREHDMIIGQWQEFGLALGQPFARLGGLPEQRRDQVIAAGAWRSTP